MFSIKTKLLWRLSLVLLCAEVVVIALVVKGWGFALSPDNLFEPARWSNIPESLVENRVRGLGGGLEYALADDFCNLLIPRFTLDEPKPTCEQLREVLQRAFDRWTAGHPILRFTDVTGQIKVEPYRAEAGAEVDIGALSFMAAAGSTKSGAVQKYWRSEPPMGTNGKILPGKTLMTADMAFNSDKCWFLDMAQANKGCAPFESIALHEMGHVLGLGHTDEQTNYDTDDDPTNLIVIDCNDPTKGLRPFANRDPEAVMRTSGPYGLVLRNDDIGGRDFLYPICPSSSQDTDWSSFHKTRSYQMIFTEY